ncbi:mitochondrial carrier domain-containing protein [Myxozyma melibiosi]|uniref:Mitochondrial carrier domain-containing protein n=1 Tax=Myxozyma melibiosi TaxID=54550 RepID=A0ABR1F1H5_9ASCO
MVGSASAQDVSVGKSIHVFSALVTPPGQDGHGPPLIYNFIAGGLGGMMGDGSMHSLDTVKTRQQGAPNAVKYHGMLRAYSTIFREEGIRKGLYGGFVPAMLGSLPGTSIFFFTYEFTKRQLLQLGAPETPAYLASGFIGDFAASFIYVPSEVLKTRLQLQGRYNNPHFQSGYNYKGTFDAIKTIIRQEGWPTLFFGYKATLVRDLPFSALQLAFYERFRSAAQALEGTENLGYWEELLTGAAAGGISGVMTTPLDVIKTRIQTQSDAQQQPSQHPPHSDKAPTGAQSAHNLNSTQSKSMHTSTKAQMSGASPISASPGVARIGSESTMQALTMIYRSEGIRGLFAGVGPRFVWTSIQSSIMLFAYQNILKALTGIDEEISF